MLGRKDYTQEELDHAKKAIDQQLNAYNKLAKAVANETSDTKVTAALGDFEVLFFNNMVLALDRPFVHRVRMVTGKDTNPLNEVELLVDSLMNNDGVLPGNNVIKYVPEQSVLRLNVGDAIRLTAGDFERLAAAFLDELERRCVHVS
jgi:hypothetical protein